MKKATLLRLIFFVSFIIFAGVINKSNAQVKKSNPDIFFPDRKRTSPTTRKNYPVWTNTQRRTRNVNNLPPGQQKKIYGDRSARDYAPGHQKKNRYYSNEGHHDKKENNRYHNGNEHGHRDNGEREHEGHRGNGHDD